MGVKQYSITIAVVSPYNPVKIIHSDQIEGDELVEVCSKIPLMIARAATILAEYKARHTVNDDDDIPF